MEGNVIIEESTLTAETEAILIRFSRDWEAEKSCHGYRANTHEDLRDNRIFLAKENGEAVGYLFGHTERSKNASSVMPDQTPFFEVEELYVVPSHRSRGIGAALFRYAEEEVSAEAEYIMLSTATKNWKAILHFYLDELDMTFWNARLYRKISPRRQGARED